MNTKDVIKPIISGVSLAILSNYFYGEFSTDFLFIEDISSNITLGISGALGHIISDKVQDYLLKNQ